MEIENYLNRLMAAAMALGWSWHEFDPGKYVLKKRFDKVEYFVVAYKETFIADIRQQAEEFDEDYWVTEWIKDKKDGAKDVPTIRELLCCAVAIQSDLLKLQYAVAAVPVKDDCNLVYGNVPFTLELTKQELSELLQCSEEYTKELLMKKLQSGELKFDGEVLFKSNHHPEPGQWRIREDIEITIHS